MKLFKLALLALSLTAGAQVKSYTLSPSDSTLAAKNYEIKDILSTETNSFMGYITEKYLLTEDKKLGENYPYYGDSYTHNAITGELNTPSPKVPKKTRYLLKDWGYTYKFSGDYKYIYFIGVDNYSCQHNLATFTSGYSYVTPCQPKDKDPLIMQLDEKDAQKAKYLFTAQKANLDDIEKMKKDFVKTYMSKEVFYFITCSPEVTSTYKEFLCTYRDASPTYSYYFNGTSPITASPGITGNIITGTGITGSSAIITNPTYTK